MLVYGAVTYQRQLYSSLFRGRCLETALRATIQWYGKERFARNAGLSSRDLKAEQCQSDFMAFIGRSIEGKYIETP
jgi:hypothetical protein